MAVNGTNEQEILKNTQMQIIIKTQSEFDALPDRFEQYTRIIIENNSERINIRIRENASVVARENASVVAWGNASVVAWENASVVARENASVVARENASVEARGNA